MSESAWFRDWFDDDYLALYAHRDDADAAAAVGFLERMVGPPKGSRVLDLACGSGRHLTRMRALGLVTIGLDLSATLLANAMASAGPVVRGDMRELPFRAATFALVTSFFTSFGYFDDAGNRRVVSEIGRVLLPSGELLLDLPNPAATRAGLVAESRRSVGDRDVIERRRFDSLTSRVIKDITITTPRGQRSVTESVRLYGPSELAVLLADAGLRLRELRGDFLGQVYDETTSVRMIARAGRP